MSKNANHGIPKNYQKLHYEKYYIMLSDGSAIECTKYECFAAEIADSVFKQRWYYSPDQSVAIRLPCNELGERIGKDNAAELKAQERSASRYRERVYIELDAPINDEGATLDFPDRGVSIEEAFFREERIEIIRGAVQELPDELKDLWFSLLAGEKQYEIAARYGLTDAAIRKRIKKMKRIFSENPALKNIFDF